MFLLLVPTWLLASLLCLAVCLASPSCSILQVAVCFAIWLNAISTLQVAVCFAIRLNATSTLQVAVCFAIWLNATSALQVAVCFAIWLCAISPLQVAVCFATGMSAPCKLLCALQAGSYPSHCRLSLGGGRLSRGDYSYGICH